MSIAVLQAAVNALTLALPYLHGGSIEIRTARVTLALIEAELVKQIAREQLADKTYNVNKEEWARLMQKLMTIG